MFHAFFRITVVAVSLMSSTSFAQDTDEAPVSTEPKASVRIECRLLQVLQVDIERDWTATLSGSKVYVDGKIEALVTAGAVIQTNRLHLAAVHGESAMVQSGKQVSIFTGRQAIRNQPTQQLLQRQQVGMLLECQPLVHEDNSVTLKLTFEKSDLAPTVGEEEGGNSDVAPPEIITMTTKSQLRLMSGTGGVVSGISQDTGERPSQWLLVVFADYSPEAGVSTAVSNSNK